jgi:hypothetical protein
VTAAAAVVGAEAAGMAAGAAGSTAEEEAGADSAPTGVVFETDTREGNGLVSITFTEPAVTYPFAGLITPADETAAPASPAGMTGAHRAQRR